MDPTGIFAAISLSPLAFERFCDDHGKALVQDINYILANRAIDREYQEALAEARSQSATLTSFLNFQKSHPSPDSRYRRTLENYLHPGSDELIIQYDLASQTMFYFYILDRRNPDEIEDVPSFRVLREVVKYKDEDGTDYVALSSSATNFNTDPIWRSFTIQKTGWSRQPDGTPIPQHVITQLDGLSQKYYFDAIDRDLGLASAGTEEEAPWIYPKDHLHPCLLRHVTEQPMNLD
ncbi:hypothetical protein VDF98_03765 [Xanthomonas campestris pv. raphani]|uniref:hypothetical protein n=1 Tax=Xanthomonas campestris TaxID=339 RepID=UPI0023677E11|nr:hypothetical protein [Xanthomonas campestris]MEA9822346.1 hypothetical protein [Xanthomonas campestris pv. raphani]MEA9850921.1 hypothetical protein [Xanthomonas campestris pv. raphani]MEA9855094.1 hypothetical protein [Xanthomonas campestris pv. raphani]WDJ20479.1 hypothetical protein JH270_11005 [Xanthomonas campestris pv. raphani]